LLELIGIGFPQSGGVRLADPRENEILTVVFLDATCQSEDRRFFRFGISGPKLLGNPGDGRCAGVVERFEKFMFVLIPSCWNRDAHQRMVFCVGECLSEIGHFDLLTFAYDIQK